MGRLLPPSSSKAWTAGAEEGSTSEDIADALTEDATAREKRWNNIKFAAADKAEVFNLSSALMEKCVAVRLQWGEGEDIAAAIYLVD